MSDSIQVGTRVRWYSTRQNRKGIRSRVGTVLQVYEPGRYAFVKPDKGDGRYQFLSLRRLMKIEAAS